MEVGRGRGGERCIYKSKKDKACWPPSDAGRGKQRFFPGDFRAADILISDL